MTALNKTVRIISHNNGEGARAIADGAKLLLKNPSAPPIRVKTLYNMGLSAIHRQITAERVVNSPALVELCSSKELTFKAMAGTGGRTVPAVFSKQEMIGDMLADPTVTYLARTIDRGSSGRGIVHITQDYLQRPDSIPDAKVYTKYIDKAREYRVHVAVNDLLYPMVVDVQRKVRFRGDDTERGIIWNHDNNFKFVRSDVNPQTVPHAVILAARGAAMRMLSISQVDATEMALVAVDVIVPKDNGSDMMNRPAYVLEVNTAPGVTGITADVYRATLNALDTDTDAPVWTGVYGSLTEDQPE